MTPPTPTSKPFGNRSVERQLPKTTRSMAARERVLPTLKQEALAKGLKVGSPVFIRSFKQEKRMEVWMKTRRGRFKRFKTYDVCSYPGPMGPKQYSGDLMIPEGFYRIGPRSLNPLSDYHLALDIGYPNRLERSLGRTGSDLMVHGGCESVGCYAVGDANMEEIYTLVYEALRNGQAAVDFHAYPFDMTEANMNKYAGHRWSGFWRNMKQGYDAFLADQRPPQILYGQRSYRVINDSPIFASTRASNADAASNR